MIPMKRGIYDIEHAKTDIGGMFPMLLMTLPVVNGRSVGTQNPMVVYR